MLALWVSLALNKLIYPKRTVSCVVLPYQSCKLPGSGRNVLLLQSCILGPLFQSFGSFDEIKYSSLCVKLHLQRPLQGIPNQHRLKVT